MTSAWSVTGTRQARPASSCERRAPVGDPVDVAPPDAAETGMEVWCGLFGAQDGDRLRPELGVQSVGKPVRRDRAFDIDMRGHAERMHAGIGPPGRVQNDRFARDRPAQPPRSPAAPKAHAPGAAIP
jgi:hypothetical protein